VAQCGELFLHLPGVSATPLLLRTLTDGEGAAADLLFDSGREAEAWQVRRGCTASCTAALIRRSRR
jgi:hypothetical protein